MSYFAHAFQKNFLATKGDQDGSASKESAWVKTDKVLIKNGILAAEGVPVWMMKESSMNMGPGVVGIFDYKTNKSLSTATSLEDGQKFYIAASSLISKDKIGKFHGGYQIENKSKYINPRLIDKVYKVIANDAVAPKKGVGCKYNDDGEIEVCDKEFLCGETYYLRIDVKGTPAMRFARHNLYRTFQADGGCCKEGSVETVNPAIIYKQWADFVNNDPMLQDFIKAYIVVDGETYSNSVEDAELAGTNTEKLIENVPTTGTKVYMVLLGSYEDTTFGNCSFAPTDYYGMEPIRIYASEVDLNGDPCVFESLCVEDICLGVQANGIGEEKLRKVLLHERYLQNHVASDPRIREITMGDDILNSVDRSAKYDSVYLGHSVPRKWNSTSTNDDDKYLLEIIMPHMDTNTGIAQLEKVLVPAIEAFSDAELDDAGTGFVAYESAAESSCTYTFPKVTTTGEGE